MQFAKQSTWNRATKSWDVTLTPCTRATSDANATPAPPAPRRAIPYNSSRAAEYDAGQGAREWAVEQDYRRSR